MLTDAANIIFRLSERRCYVMTQVSKRKPNDNDPKDGTYNAPDKTASQGELAISGNTMPDPGQQPSWLPDGLVPVLEELPKWNLLATILQEIEEELLRQEVSSDASEFDKLVLHE
jgi:DNA excision repair protein ERCC-4